MKFKIKNKSRYQTRHLRSFVTRAYRIAATCAGPNRTAEFERYTSTIVITFARSNRRSDGASTGHASYNRGRAHIGLHDKACRIDVALTIAHEFGHCFGLRHSDMRGGPLDAYHWRTDEWAKESRARMFGWADALPLQYVPAKAKPTLDVKRFDRLCRIEARIKAWGTKRKRADNAIKKLTAQQAPPRQTRSISMTTEIKQGYICAACHGVTSEPNRDRIIHPGESDWTVLLSCPDCGHDEMDECSLCISCLECGEDTEATHDEYCKPHFDEEQMGEAEAQADSRKFDQPPHDAATATGMYDHDDIN